MAGILVLIVFVSVFTWLGWRIGYSTGYFKGVEAGILIAHDNIEEMRRLVAEWDAI